MFYVYGLHNCFGSLFMKKNKLFWALLRLAGLSINGLNEKLISYQSPTKITTTRSIPVSHKKHKCAAKLGKIFVIRNINQILSYKFGSLLLYVMILYLIILYQNFIFTWMRRSRKTTRCCLSIALEFPLFRLAIIAILFFIVEISVRFKKSACDCFSYNYYISYMGLMYLVLRTKLKSISSCYNSWHFLFYIWLMHMGLLHLQFRLWEGGIIHIQVYIDPGFVWERSFLQEYIVQEILKVLTELGLELLLLNLVCRGSCIFIVRFVMQWLLPVPQSVCVCVCFCMLANNINVYRLVSKGCRLIGCGSAVPALKLSNDDLAKLVDTNDEWISVRTGIRNRRVLSGQI